MTDLAPTTAPAEATPKGLVSRVVGVFFSPRATFASIAANPKALGVLFLSTFLVAFGLYLLLQTQVGQDAWIDQQVRQSEAFGRPLNDQQYNGLERIAPIVGYIVLGGYLVVIPIVVAIVSAILLGIFNALLGGDATYKQVIAVVSHAGVITALQGLFAVPLDYARQSLSSPTTLAVFLPFLDENTFLARLLGTIDVFQIWWLLTLSIGLGVLYKRRTTPIAIGLYIVYFAIIL
ncbi:MAG TPA: YIP1 family protein, partial [Vicinamibacterales bacterium]|nr:YIP1 family protein [Vicinamibacterales bacterium]